MRDVSSQETHTLQVWPGGESFEYQGDPNGPASQRQLRRGHYQSKLRCSAYCRLFTIDLLSEADHDRYIAAHTEGKEIARGVFPKVGRYILPADDSDDWTTGPVCPSCNGEGYINNPKRNPWRKGTPEEWREILINIRAEMYQERDVLTHQTALIDDLIKADWSYENNRNELAEAFTYESDNFSNLRTDPSDWDAQTCREWLEERGHDLPDVPKITCSTCKGVGEIDVHAAVKCETCKGTGGYTDPDADEDDSYLDALRSAINDNAEDAEVMEWWLVTRWLCEQLRGIGEVVLDNGYGHWWGRCATGQAFIMDGTLQKIAATFTPIEEVKGEV